MRKVNFASNERILANLLIHDVKNYDKWCKQMKALFVYQDVLDMIKNGMSHVVECDTQEQRASHKEEKYKDLKVLF